MKVEEENKIIDCISGFGAEMLKKILKKGRQGHAGWDSQDCAAYMQHQLTEHCKKGDYVDVANIAMFLWKLELTLTEIGE